MKKMKKDRIDNLEIYIIWIVVFVVVFVINFNFILSCVCYIKDGYKVNLGIF